MIEHAVVLAQATGVAIPDLFGEIARTGLLGVLFVLVIYALIKRDKDLSAERAARLADALGMRTLIEADTAARVASNSAREENNRLMETLARNQEQLASVATNLVNAAIAHDTEQYEKIVNEIHNAVSEIRKEALAMSNNTDERHK